MDFSIYLSKNVKIDISNGYYYAGSVINTDERFLTLVDKKGKNVTILISDIVNVREVGG